jgi:putative salt-induced outer membrane protein YdiY
MLNIIHVVVTVGFLGALSMAVAQPAAPPPNPKWESSASLGLTLTRGNSDTLLFTGNVLTSKKAVSYEINAGADATYGEIEDTKNAESFHAFGQYNRIFNENWFGYFRIDGLHDAIADVEYRFTFSPGLGYYFIKNDRTRLSAEVGPAFIYEKQGDDTKGYFTARLAERFEYKFTEKSKLWQSVEFLPQVDDLDNYLINGEIGVDTPLTEKLSLRTFLQDTYDNQPAPGREKNDLKLVTALAYKF